MSGSDEELQQLSQQLQQVESQLEALQTQVQNLQALHANIGEAIDAIESLDTGSTVQVPVGGGAYVRASVEDMDEVIVGIGGGYATEQTEGEAVETLDDRQERIEERIEDLQESIAELEAQGEELGQEAQQRLARLRQQQGGAGGLQDALGGGGDDAEDG